MSFADMRAELRGALPKIPYAYTATLINRAWRFIREKNLWSFNLVEFSWISPPLETSGTVTVTQGLPGIVFDATARAALLADQIAQPYSLLTQRQFRAGTGVAGGIYNIISIDPTFGANGIATLDRPFGDVGGAGLSYQVYQLYYVPPVKDFLALISVRNPSMFLDLFLDKTRAQVDAEDPQRSWYQFPTCVVPFMLDNRPNSATAGFQMYELWGQPVAPFVYQCYGVRRGVPLVNPADAIPSTLDESLVMHKARAMAYEWAEANKELTPRNSGPDWRYLRGLAESEFNDELKLFRKQDKEFVDNYLNVRIPAYSSRGWGFYNTIAGFAGPYSPL